MKSLYAACLSRLGLSLAAAADLHNVDISTVKHWSAGRRPVPDGIWDELRQVETEIVNRAETIEQMLADSGADAIDINDTEGDPLTLMAMADVLMNCDLAVHVGETDTTRIARQARRPN